MLTILFLLSFLIHCKSFFITNHASIRAEKSKWNMEMMSQPQSSRDVSRRDFATLSRTLIGLGALATSVPNSARAFDLFPSAEQQGVDAVSAFQKPVFELLNMLRPSNVPNALGVYSMQQQLKGGKDDSDVVLLYNINYIIPLQKKMDEVASKLKLGDQAAQERIELLPKLMLGHSLELKEAIKSMKADEQLKEVKEVEETLIEFLNLASQKYRVRPYVDVGQVSDKDLYGPLGCEFWGKVRAEGSNACIDTNEIKK